MSQVTPFTVFAQVSGAVPPACRQNIVIIGSLAAGYHFFKDDKSKIVRTKDVDCVLEPFHTAVDAGQNIARKLLDAGWQRRMLGDHLDPGNADTPVDKLPAVRLYPPGVDPKSEDAWFLELLTVPEPSNTEGKKWIRLQLAEGDFGLPTFRFLSLTAYNPINVQNLGISYAQPEMMALANLLEHPRIKSDLMSSTYAGRSIKRSNKDLGRVLAIARLADLNDYRPWAGQWHEALKDCFPNEWSKLVKDVGLGMRELLRSENDFEEAHHTCLHGLLASEYTTLDELKDVGNRVLAEAIETLENM